jgi:hypothetical protein
MSQEYAAWAFEIDNRPYVLRLEREAQLGTVTLFLNEEVLPMPSRLALFVPGYRFTLGRHHCAVFLRFGRCSLRVDGCPVPEAPYALLRADWEKSLSRTLLRSAPEPDWDRAELVRSPEKTR